MNNYLLLLLKLSLIESDFGNFRIDKGQTSLDFITKTTATNVSICSLIGINPDFTRFSYNNFKTRVLTVSFQNLDDSKNRTNMSCSINVLFAITKLNSLDSSIKDYITDDAENFFHIFTPQLNNVNPHESSKEINVNNRVYMDSHDLFLLNLTTIISLTAQTQSYFNSPRDSYLMVSASSEVMNGALNIDAELGFVRNRWTNSDDEVERSYKLSLDLRLSRPGTYWNAEAVYSLEMVDPLRLTLNKVSDQIVLMQLKDVLLKSSETNRTFQVQLF